jgi:hypothetical protein
LNQHTTLKHDLQKSSSKTFSDCSGHFKPVRIRIPQPEFVELSSVHIPGHEGVTLLPPRHHRSRLTGTGGSYRGKKMCKRSYVHAACTVYNCMNKMTVDVGIINCGKKCLPPYPELHSHGPSLFCPDCIRRLEAAKGKKIMIVQSFKMLQMTGGS